MDSDDHLQLGRGIRERTHLFMLVKLVRLPRKHCGYSGTNELERKGICNVNAHFFVKRSKSVIKVCVSENNLSTQKYFSVSTTMKRPVRRGLAFGSEDSDMIGDIALGES